MKKNKYVKKQKTIAKKIFFQGFGLYTPKKTNLILNPAPEHTGFLFKRIDLEENVSIEFSFLYFFQEKLNNGIILEKNGIKIYTTEHIIAALYGMDIDNIIIELDNIEVPILDGSSKIFVKAIENVGIIEQKIHKKIFFIEDVITVKSKKNNVEIIALPSNKFEIIAIVDFGSNKINNQNAVLKDISQFKDIADSRIFCVLNKKIFKKLFNLNEIAKHFLLDFIAFLALIKTKIIGKFIIYNLDKSIIIEFLKKIIKQIRLSELMDIDKYDLEAKPIFDIKNIMKILPHKPPFLLVDKIIDISTDYIIGVKNVTINEPFFIGHFPNEPIMPGVLQIEAIAQVGGILFLNKIENPKLYSTYLLKINNVKFRQKIIPGDIIIFLIYLLEPIKIGLIRILGMGFVNKKLVVEAEVIAKISKKNNK
ncbi:3-hydroxyacyl-ACP dehydratase FabZ [Blattabacterium cuenoti]|uniref:3-hydroxyacyl-ACP dehydratase FabZ n=1 Tax=Blattabacterium cuenoti TaxID=1653831 RepID=UPI00163BF74B|nr:3-hydroxyacyl-ACP dehydratase FabZ [Blattabacterium cuenoti]